MFRVFSEYIQSMFRICFISSSSASSVSVFGIFYVKPLSSLLVLNLPKREEAMFNDLAVNEKKEGRTCVKLA